MATRATPTPVTTPALPRNKVIDVRFVRMVAYKRVVTGGAGLLLGPLVLAFTIAAPGRTGQSTMLGVFGFLAFVGGGGWALRDGLRIVRDLKKL